MILRFSLRIASLSVLLFISTFVVKAYPNDFQPASASPLSVNAASYIKMLSFNLLKSEPLRIYPTRAPLEFTKQIISLHQEILDKLESPILAPALAAKYSDMNMYNGVASAVRIPLRVLLQGALANAATPAQMRDDLRSKHLIPTNEPYTSLGYTHIGGAGGEAISNPSSVFSVTGTDAIIDWVVVELRSASTPATILATRSGLVQADGDVVDLDGVSSLTFGNGASAGIPYYVAVHHRNHLGVMTASPVATSGIVALIDFSLPATLTYQFPLGNPLRTSAPQAVEGNVMAMWAGNTTGDNQIIRQGPDNEVDNVFFDILADPANTQGFTNFVRSNAYSANDINMDGRVIFQGPGNEVDFIFFEIFTHPDNTNRYVNFIIRQQIP